MSDCHVTCTKCGWELDSSGRCGHCGRKHKFTVTAQSNDYLYIESGEKEKIIMQQQEKIAELQKRIDELEAQNEQLQFKLDSLCTCENNPQYERYMLVDKNCPVHGKR